MISRQVRLFASRCAVFVLLLAFVVLIFSLTRSKVMRDTIWSKNLRSFIANGDGNESHSPDTESVHKKQNKETAGRKSGKSFSPHRQLVKNGTVLILTALHNAERHLGRFNNLLKTLSYPKHLISIAFGEDNSNDRTVEKAAALMEEWRETFADVRMFTFGELPVNGTGLGVRKHKRSRQKNRRQHMAYARNYLLSSVSLCDVDYALWIDVDVIVTPPDVIQQLIAAKKDIVVPNCRIEYDQGRKRETYDLNSWKETNESLRFQREKRPTYLFLEGYGQKRPARLYLDDLTSMGDLVEIDSVGGCMLLIKAEHHRKGLMFPPFQYRNQIETEGLSRMAQDMGLKIFGMPQLHIYHICEKGTGFEC